jgi:hypothetical protein
MKIRAAEPQSRRDRRGVIPDVRARFLHGQIIQGEKQNDRSIDRSDSASVSVNSAALAYSRAVYL